MASSWNKGELVETPTEPSLVDSSVTQQTLRRVEARGVDTLWANFESGETPFKDYTVSSKTIGELYDFSKPSGEYGRYVFNHPSFQNTAARKRGLTSTPMGKYQIVGTTLRSAAAQLGLSEDTVFDEATQDKIFLHLAKQRVARGKTMADKRRELRAEWEGFELYVDDATLDKIILEIEGNG